MDKASCLHEATQAPQLIQIAASIFTTSSRLTALTGQTSTHPAQAPPPQEQLEVHLPSFQQHFE
jgi:hypothetical protein